MKYSELDIQAVEQAADIRDIIPDLKGRGATKYCKCPNCGKEGKDRGLQVWHKRQSDGTYRNGAKCHACGYTIGGAIKAYMQQKGVEFLNAVETLARDYNVNLVPLDQKTSRQEKKKNRSFCDMQLFASGLTSDDILVKVPIPGTDDFKLVPSMRKGGADNACRNFNEIDDEMLIYYYDLDGNQVKYSERGGKGSMKPYIRTRWSNPALHKDANGKETKYQTQKGAPCIFYIPQKIRDIYHRSEHIETLVIQEGEKKAEKACKHGIQSIGIQGIYNIGNADTGLIKELQYIVKRCSVKNIVLLMDSDWDHLSRSLQSGDRVDQRPKQFAKAVIKFKTYVQTLHKLGMSFDVWFGHINDNERGDKGIDDLLVGTLHLHEDELAEDFDAAMHSHDGHGKYVDIHKISTKTDFQIMDFWKLNSRAEFFEKYKDAISGLATFNFSGITYISDNGEFREAARGTETNFWNVTKAEKSEKESVEFDYIEALKFLDANQFHIIHTPELKTGEYKFVKIDDFVIEEKSPTDIRRFVSMYVRQSTKSKLVVNAFISRIKTWLGNDILEQLEEIEDNFNYIEPMAQTYFYRNKKLKITADDITENEIAENVWRENQIQRKFHRQPIFGLIDRDENGFYFDLTPEGEKCEFMQYMLATSNFWKGREETMTAEDHNMLYHHIVNKVTAIGFLLNQWKPRSEQIAIIGMDSKMDEVGSSNGRSGKSMVGLALSKMVNVQTIDMKKVKNDDDFIYSLVTPKTRVVFLDDTRVNFDFENFYSALTGDMQINPKQGGRFEIKYEAAPKFLITTNHAINDQSESGRDRRVMIAFSNFFSTKYSPSDYFGHLMFDDWDAEQWNLFDNLMAECVMYYLRSMQNGWTRKGRGVVPPPMEQLERRALRQRMGEAFLSWAETYFDPSGSILNYKVTRKTLTENYHQEFPNSKEQIRPSDFRKRMIAFCRYKGLHFNPNSPNDEGVKFSDWIREHPGETFVGESYKSNSKEFWTIATDEFSKVQPW